MVDARIWLFLVGLLSVSNAVAQIGPIASAPCNTLCQGVGDAAEGAGAAEQRKFAACFSCRCKESLGWMPAPQDLKCSAGAPLARYRARTEPGGGERPLVTAIDTIDPEGTSTEGCLNGGIAAAGCDLKSRWRRLINDTVEFQVLCRQPTHESNGYYEYLIIGNNTRNGATCFWQARSSIFDGETVPSLDVTDANHAPIPDAVERYASIFYLYSAGPSTCTSCHGGDAFIWSPYFHSAYPVPLSDSMVRTRLRGPYFKVSAASERLQPVGHRALLAGPATGEPNAPSTPLACTGCHRVADGSFCSSFSWQALGHSDRAGTMSYDPATAFEHGRDLMFWMPPGGRTHQEWQTRSTADLSRIRECCINGGHPACRWSDPY